MLFKTQSGLLHKKYMPKDLSACFIRSGCLLKILSVKEVSYHCSSTEMKRFNGSKKFSGDNIIG